MHEGGVPVSGVVSQLLVERSRCRSRQPIQWACSEWAVAPDWIESPGNTT